MGGRPRAGASVRERGAPRAVGGWARRRGARAARVRPRAPRWARARSRGRRRRPRCCRAGSARRRRRAGRARGRSAPHGLRARPLECGDHVGQVDAPGRESLVDGARGLGGHEAPERLLRREAVVEDRVPARVRVLEEAARVALHDAEPAVALRVRELLQPAEREVLAGDADDLGVELDHVDRDVVVARDGGRGERHAAPAEHEQAPRAGRDVEEPLVEAVVREHGLRPGVAQVAGALPGAVDLEHADRRAVGVVGVHHAAGARQRLAALDEVLVERKPPGRVAQPAQQGRHGMDHALLLSIACQASRVGPAHATIVARPRRRAGLCSP